MEILNPEVAERLRRLPMRTVADVERTFPGIPVKVEVETDHIGILRLVTTTTCRMGCGYPGTGEMWCHDEGQERNGLRAANLTSMLEVVRHFRDTFGMKQVNLAGLQPKLDDELVEFVRKLRYEEGIESVAFTSHGLRLTEWLEKLVDAGLTTLQLSVQGFSPSTYRDIMAVDAFDNAMRVVDLANKLSLPLAINRVLLKSYIDDIPEMLDWINKNNLRVRLYDVMWKPGQDNNFLNHHVSWQTLTDLWIGSVERISVWDYGQAGRLNLVFWLKGGGSIETNISVPWEIHTAPACQKCPVKDACVEGWLGCGARITPDLRVQPCLWRQDLSVSLLPLVTGKGEPPSAESLERLMAGDVHLERPSQLTVSIEQE